MKKNFLGAAFALAMLAGGTILTVQESNAKKNPSFQGLGHACPDINLDSCCTRGSGDCLDDVVIDRFI